MQSHVPLSSESNPQPGGNAEQPATGKEIAPVTQKQNSKFDLSHLTLYVGVAVAIIYLCQLLSMQQSVRLARITVEVDQRAWLSLRQEPFQFHTGTELSIPLTANNIGKTPARNIRGWVFVQRVQKDTNVDFSSPTDTTPPRKYAYTKFNQGRNVP